MSKTVDLYNPYSNVAVTQYYVDIVAEAYSRMGYRTRTVQKLCRSKDNESILVVYPHDCKVAHSMGYKDITLWIQGISPEESFMRHSSYARLFYLSLRERIGLAYANRIIMVSDYMRKHYEQKYHKRFEKVFFMPCFNTEIDLTAFSEPDKYSNNVFTYTGGLAAWQCFEETVRLYSKLEQNLENCSFEVLTPDQEAAENILKKYNVQNYHVDYVLPDELHNRLKHVKYGFVLRENNDVNKVATPTKLSTYLSSGIIPIYSSCLNDFYTHTKNCRFMLPIHEINDDTYNVDTILKFAKKSIEPSDVLQEYRGIFDSYYNREMYINRLLQFLNY